jgi:hypothetical protein
MMPKEVKTDKVILCPFEAQRTQNIILYRVHTLFCCAKSGTFQDKNYTFQAPFSEHFHI